MSYHLLSNCFPFRQQMNSTKFDDVSCRYPDCITQALHAAFLYHATDELILALLASYKDSAKESCPNGGGLPLHKAIESNYSDEVVLALLEANPGAAMVESDDGELPLHQIIKKSYSDAVAMAIFSSFPSAAMIRCKQTGMLPLHLAASSSASPLLVKALIKEYPEALDIKVLNSTPRDLVTSSLPVESMKMICRPSLYWMNLLANIVSETPVTSKTSSSSSSKDFSFVEFGQPEHHRYSYDYSLVDGQRLKKDLSFGGSQGNTDTKHLTINEHPHHEPHTTRHQTFRGLRTSGETPQTLPSSMASERSVTSTTLSSTFANDFSCRGCHQPKHHGNSCDYSSVDGQRLKQDLFFGESFRNTDKNEMVLSEHAPIENPSHWPQAYHITRSGTSRKLRTPGVTPKGYVQNFVQHDYHDHSSEPPWETELLGQHFKLNEAVTFPMKLHLLLSQVEADGLADIISWQPHGRAFKIHDRNKFVETVMPNFFRQTKFESFRRQLCLYGFLSFSQGPDKGALYHERFLRGRAYLAKRIIRQRLKGTKIRTVASPETEPDFYCMPYIDAQSNG